MTQQTINVGTAANTGSGDPLRTAMQKCNSNFTDLYTSFGLVPATALANQVFAGPTSGGPAAPAFRALVAGDIPGGGGSSGANPTASVGLTAVNGAAGTFLRSDGAPALSQAITPNWSNTHTFSGFTDALVIAGGSLNTNSTAGTTGQVLTSQGSGSSPIWGASPLVEFIASVQTGVTFTSTTVLANITDLTVTIPGPAHGYAVDGLLMFSEDTSSAGGFKFDWGNTTGPGTGINFSYSGFTNANVSAAVVVGLTSAVAFPTIQVTTNISFIRMTGNITMGNAGGQFGMRGAQNASSANPTTLYIGSYIRFTLVR
jgi:hypothetical protein